jgi:hypothetical protein
VHRQQGASARELRLDRVGEQAVLRAAAVQQRARDARRSSARARRAPYRAGSRAGVRAARRARHGGAGDIGFRPAPAAVGHVLHQTHLLHRHGVAGEAPRISATDRQVVDADGQLRIRQAARACRRGLRRIDTRRLQRDIGRLAPRQVQRGVERQRLGASEAGNRHQQGGQK